MSHHITHAHTPIATQASSSPASVVGQRSSVVAAYWRLAAIMLVGFALRLWLLSVNTLDPRFSNADDGDYYHRALRFAVTGQYIDDSWLIRPPLHVAFFAIWLRLALIIGQPQLGVLFVQLAQVAIGTLTIALGYGVARRLFANQRAGLVFAVFLALWHPFVEQPTVLFSELLYLFLFLLHVWLLLRFDASNRLRDLALSGVALGAAALTRSPALYSVAFVALWLLVRQLTTAHRPPPTTEINYQASSIKHHNTARAAGSRFSVFGSILVVIVCCLAVVGPWTARNYIVYGKLIPVDTLGQTNLWLDLDKVSARNDHIEEMRSMPQGDRASFAMGKALEILRADPLRPFEPMWATFRHIWKAQFIEDYYVKQSFFTRPLRAVAPLGLVGDALWLVFTVAGLVGLASPAREGWHNRLFFLLWLGYSFFTVLVFHVEPRYLIPIWMLFGLYGAGALAKIKVKRGKVQNTILHWSTFAFYLLPFALVVAFFYLFITYRDYPYIIAHGAARESAIKAGDQAYAKNDYPTAERAFRAALVAQPNFVDAQIDLALALSAQGKRDEATQVVKAGGSRQADLVLGTLARAAGDDDKASAIIRRIESTSGEDTQAWALEWLRPPAISALQLGNGLDIGYIAGFSPGESDDHSAYRWLEGNGRIELPLPATLPAGATLALRMSGGWQATTPLEVRIGAITQIVPVTRGEWRTYYLPIPPTLAGQQRLVVELRAPTFVPARVNPASDDARTLSLMISNVRVR